jgi:hypothetical protein
MEAYLVDSKFVINVITVIYTPEPNNFNSFAGIIFTNMLTEYKGHPVNKPFLIEREELDGLDFIPWKDMIGSHFDQTIVDRGSSSANCLMQRSYEEPDCANPDDLDLHQCWEVESLSKPLDKFIRFISCQQKKHYTAIAHYSRG